MTPQFKTFLKIFFAVFALFGALWLAEQWALRMLPHIDRCDMPCQWEHDKGFVSCQPLKTALEIKTTPEPNGRGQAVWFRAATTNQSCRTILLHTEFYAPRSEQYGQMIDLIITDEMGRRAPTDYGNGSGGALGVDKKIYPYTFDNKIVSPLIRTEAGLRGEELSFVHLDPGQTVTTGHTELAPYRIKYIDVDTKDYVGTAAVPEPVPMENPEKIYAAPPSGFRRLIGYDLRRPGRYSARFIIKEELPVERFDDPRAPFQNKLRRIVYRLATGWEGDRGSFVKADVSSSSVEFEIKK